MQIHELTALARNNKASDIHISEGLPLMFRIDGHLAEAPVQLSAAETRSLILSLMDEAHREAITSERIDADFALVAPDGTRSRVNVFYQQGRAAATLRLLNDSIPTLEELAMPPVLTKLADEPRGLILVTGPTGSGKSTTLAAMIDHINKTRSDHIITIEDPIEYVYQGRCSLIHQREVGADVRSFASALRSALREDPDVILVGEMRDYETISAAVTAAETGHLVMSTLHTIGAAQTIDRIIDVCPAGAQNQIRGQLAADLVLRTGRADVDDAVNRLRRADGVQRAHDKVSGLGSRDGSGNRLIVAHLADEDDVGVLTQGAAQRRSKAAHIGADLALVDQRAAALIDVLDGVLNRDDVVAARLIDVVDHGGQRGGFAAARGACDQDQAARLVGQLCQNGRHGQLLQGRDRVVQQAQCGRGPALLVKDVHTAAGPVGRDKRKVCVDALRCDGLAVGLVHQAQNQRARLCRRKLDRCLRQMPVDAEHQRQPLGDMNIAGLVVPRQRGELMDLHGSYSSRHSS